MTAEPVAIVGIGCRFAGGIDGPEDLWRACNAGEPIVGEVPPDRWRAAAEASRESAAALERVPARGAFRDDVAGFDAAFFGISAREAEQLDPQQRVTLEVAWEALEDAAIPPTDLAGSDTAVFLGVGVDDYGRRLLEDLPHVRAWTGIGASLCGVPNRISHALDLRGPSVALDSACSSSLVAVHQACAALRNGESRIALAGGVMLMTGPGLTAVLGEAGALGADGRSKPFDAAADGYGRGEGAAVVVLKRLSDARADGDDVLATIRGGAVRQDGRTEGIMAPSGDAQAELVRAAYAAAGVDPCTVGYVEAHGTGTPAGDPTEARALCATLARPTDRPVCRVGSVKATIGHTEAAAGVAGLIAATLALRHRHVPALPAGPAGPRADVPWASANLTPATTAADWPDPGHPRRAGVASYGYGGTIAHVVLEEHVRAFPCQDTETHARARSANPLSAASPEALAVQAERLADAVAAPGAPALADVATTLATGRAPLRHRAVVTADDRDGLVAGLRALAAGTPDERVTTAAARPDEPVVWVFSGHGAQWAGMGRGLLDVDPEFTATIDRLAPVYRAELGVTPREMLSADDLGGVDRIQAALVAVALGLAATWRARGLRPAAVIGHSVGEIAAAVVAGALSEDDGARLACRRSALLPRVAGRGAMALVDLPFAEVRQRCGSADAERPEIHSDHGAVEPAIAASPSSTVVAGTPAAVEAAARRWEVEGRVVRRVDSDVAFHTAQMAPLAAELADAVADLRPRTPDVPLYATALDDPRSTAARDADYWAANLRNPVRFADAVAAAVDDGFATFLEVSAHPVVAHSISETGGTAFPSLRRGRREPDCLAATTAALHCRGVPVSLGPTHGRRVRLPGVAWRHRPFWVERRPATPPGPPHTLLGHRADVHGTSARVWTTTLHPRTRPYPGRHPVLGVEIVPAAVTLVTYLAAGATTGLADVRLQRPVVVGEEEDPARELQVVHDGALRLATRAPGSGGWTEHSSARPVPGCLGAPRLDASRADEPVDAGTVVERLGAAGVAAMGFPWRIDKLHRSGDTLVGEVDADPDAVLRSRSWASLLDAALSIGSVAGPDGLRMPTAIARVTVGGDAPDRAVIVVGRVAPDVVDVEIRGEDGALLATLDGLRYAEPDGDGARPELAETVFAVQWRASDVTSLASDVSESTSSNVLVEADEDPRTAVRALLDAVRGATGPVWALTRGLRTGDASDGDAAVAGLGRVLATECPETFGGVLDLPRGVAPPALPRPGTEPVVSLDGDRWLAPRAVPLGRASGAAPVCRPDGTYLVTGGLGAVGLAVATHLAGRGARRLVLLGRTPLPPRSHWEDSDDPRVAAVREIERAGAAVFTVAADVTDAPAVAAALDALPLPPVRGVVHAAGAVRSGPALGLSQDDLDVTLAAKVDGARVLNRLFPPGTLDFLALFSSAGPLLGLPGQGAYAAANGVLDGLAARRRMMGDDGVVSIAWTSWRNLGMAGAAAATDVELDARGSADLTPERALAALDRVLATRIDAADLVDPHPCPHDTAPSARRRHSEPVSPRHGTTTPHDASPALVAVLPVRTDHRGPQPALLAALEIDRPAEPERRSWADLDEQGRRDAVRAQVTAVLGTEVDDDAPLGEAGVDSLLGATLRVRLERATGASLAPTLLWKHPTVDAIAAHLAQRKDDA